MKNNTSPENAINLPYDIDNCFKKLALIGQRHTYPKNRIISSPNPVCDCCYAVLSGQVIGFEYTNTGTEIDFVMRDKNMLFLETELLLGTPLELYFKTTKESELVSIDRETLIRTMKEDFEITMLVTLSLAKKFDHSLNENRKTILYSTMWRLCDLLARLAANYGKAYDGKIMIAEKISQQTMGNLLHINRITVVRHISELKAAGLIEQINGFYCIRSIKKLDEYREGLDNPQRKQR